MSPLTCLLIVAACLLVQAFFAGMEMALVSSNRLRLIHLSEKGSRRARIITALLQTPEKVLATTLVGINVVLILGASVASYFFSDVLGLGQRGAALATAVMVPLILVFAEITPKTLSRPRATQVALFFIFPLRLAQLIIYPLVQAMSWLTGKIVRLLGVKSGQSRMFSSIEDFLLLMKEGQTQGILSTEERKMISRVFDFGRTNPTNQDLMDFKRRWGAEVIELSHFYYPPGVCERLNGKESTLKFKLAKSACVKAPDYAFEALGKFLYRHI